MSDLRFPLPDQLGFVVEDLDAALAVRHAAFEIEAWDIYTYDETIVRDMSCDGRPASFAMRVALSRSTPQIELIQPLAGRNVYDEWLERGRTGVHHIGFWTDSIDVAVRELEGKGLRTIQFGRGYGEGGDGGFAYFDTVDQLGIIVEAIEVPRVRRTPERVWPPQGA